MAGGKRDEGEARRKIIDDMDEAAEGAGPDAPETLEPVETPPKEGGPIRWRDGGGTGETAGPDRSEGGDA